MIKCNTGTECEGGRGGGGAGHSRVNEDNSDSFIWRGLNPERSSGLLAEVLLTQISPLFTYKSPLLLIYLLFCGDTSTDYRVWYRSCASLMPHTHFNKSISQVGYFYCEQMVPHPSHYSDKVWNCICIVSLWDLNYNCLSFWIEMCTLLCIMLFIFRWLWTFRLVRAVGAFPSDLSPTVWQGNGTCWFYFRCEKGFLTPSQTLVQPGSSEQLDSEVSRLCCKITYKEAWTNILYFFMFVLPSNTYVFFQSLPQT